METLDWKLKTENRKQERLFKRAVPLAIFQAESSISKHYLRKWLKAPAMHDFDIRLILDWDYYIERLGAAIQKIITIPAALQGLSNPVPRIAHPDWLHKKMLEKNDVYKQKRINEMFAPKPKPTASQEAEQLFSQMDSQSADIEDIGGAKTGPTSGQIAVVSSAKRKRDGAAQRDTDKNDADLSQSWREALGPPPAMGKTKDAVSAWVVFQKKKWAFQARQRAVRHKRRRLEENGHPSGVGLVRSSTTAGVGGFLRKKGRTLLDQPWQVVQLAEIGPGQYRLWALVGSDLHAIKLNVPRIFYVNQKSPKTGESDMWKKVNRLLPRSHPVYSLYEYCVPEHIYQEHINEINTDLSSPDIEGVYETQVPLEFRALLKLGCVCTVNRQVARTLVGKETDTFDLDHLDFKTLAQYSYLDPGSLKHLYLYHHVSGAKQMFGLFLPGAKKALVFAFDTVRTNQMPNMTALYNAEHSTKMGKGVDEEMLPATSHTFEVNVEKDLHKVYRLIQRQLTAYRDEKRGPTMIAVQSPLDVKRLVSVMPNLGDFPLVPIHVTDDENLYGVLDWQRTGSRRMIQHYLNVNIILQAMLEQCRYFHIPLGNMPKDTTLFGCDLFCARHLQKHNHLLWCSPTERPDLGGKEADDNRLSSDNLESMSLEVNNPGCHSTVCVELDMASLAVNTLIQSAHVNDYEGASAVSFDSMPQISLEDMVQGQGAATMLASYDETALCSSAFRIMKSMVHGWIRDVANYQNVFADHQIINFYRWLRSPSALLYDPALRQSLHNMMKKIFMQLIAEFKRLGAVIVYANFNQLLLCTKKRLVVDALAYTEYITNSIRGKELFHMIDISYKQLWTFLMWMDPANHGGVKGELPFSAQNQDPSVANSQSSRTDQSDDEAGEGAEPNEEQDEELNQSDTEDEPDVEMNWNLVRFLPEAGACQTNFTMIIAGYILSVYKHLQEDVIRQTPGNTPVRRRENTQTQPVFDASATPASVEFSQGLIQDDICQNMFMLTQKIQKKLSGYHGNINNMASEFPILPGSHLSLKNPALEFVKSVSQVLSLDSNVTIQVLKMKRDLLKLIGVGEFSDDAHFIDPCLSYVVPEVICGVCNHIRDVDLCRDPYLTHDAGTLSLWSCIHCKAEYDKDDIELHLVSVIQRKAMAYTLQDLVCKKCKGVKMTNLARNCKCAGDFQTTMPLSEITQTLTTCKHIASHYKMTLLRESVEWILTSNPNLENTQC